MGGTPPEDDVEAELVLEWEWVDMVDQETLDMAALMVLTGAASGRRCNMNALAVTPLP
jgi:hypothetical protein